MLVGFMTFNPTKEKKCGAVTTVWGVVDFAPFLLYPSPRP